MAQTSACPNCQCSMLLPELSLGARVKCRKCGQLNRVVQTAEGGLGLVDHHTAGKVQRRVRRRPRRRATYWLVCLAAIFLMIGTAQGMLAVHHNRMTLEAISGLADDALVQDPFDGTWMSAGDYRQQLVFVEIFAYATGYLISVFMVGLYLWARRSPLPAVLVAWLIGVAFILVDAVAHPEGVAVGLYSGLLLKVFVLAFLLLGLQAALNERAVARAARATDEPSVAG